jgi:hypothetical protein
LWVRQALRHFGGQNGTIRASQFLLADFSSSAVALPCLSSSTGLRGYFPTSIGETLRFEATLSGIGDFIRFQY